MRNSFHYTAYGLDIQSELPLPELLSGDGGTPDVCIHYGKVPDSLSESSYGNRTWEAIPGKFLIRIHKIANYFVQNGREIIIERFPGSSDDDVRTFLLGSTFGALFHQRGMLALHASAIQTERGAALFAGRSGSGKSTLMAAFLQRGYAALSDDVTGIIADETGHPLALPALPRTRLWSDAASKLNIDTRNLKSVRKGLEKYLLPVDHFCDEALPVFAVFVLRSHNKQNIEAVSLEQTDRLPWLIRYTYRKRFVYGLGLQTSHFEKVVALAQSVEVIKITRPDTHFVLEELIDLVEEALKC